jgi:asparagine synthase (glutamine-hydrolysing)
MKWLRFLSEALAYVKNHKSFYGIGSMGYFLLPSVLRGRTRLFNSGYLQPGFVKKYEKSNSISSTLYSSASLHEALLDHFEYKLEHLLKWEDKNSMWFSLEARVPFLDFRLVERTLSLPPEKLIKDGSTKYILRQAMEGILPENIRLRKDKIGFSTPENSWFRQKEFKLYIEKLIGSDSFRSRNIFVPGKVESIYQRHLEGKTDAARELWKCIHLENWYRQFID